VAISTDPSADPGAGARSGGREGITERVHAVDYLDERARKLAKPASGGAREGALAPGRYLEVQGPRESLLVPLEREVTHIGRGLAADLRVDENSVSRRHAMLVQDERGARILDDRSSNGTFVNSKRVEQAELAHGDQLMLGRVMLRYLEV
jgi:hypothetical protein